MFNSFSEVQESLKHNSFESKMNYAQIESAKSMNPLGSFAYDPMKLVGKVFPWEIEAFTILSSMSLDDDNKVLDRQSFMNAINHIRDFIPPDLLKYKGKNAMAEWFIITCSQVQFECQKNYMFLFYRYNYYFNYVNNAVNMKSLFKEKFGFEHYEYLTLAQLLWFSFTLNFTVFDRQRFMTAINRRYHEHIAKYLTITREEFNAAFLRTGNSIENCVYSLRPSYSYPFIKFNDCIYLPTPHLLFQAVTTSMLYRLTENDASLRETIGKNVFEGYLEMISRNSGLFDEIYEEQVYKVGKKEHRSLDLLTRINDTFILFDSKSFTPKSALRLFSEKAYTDDIKRLAKAVAQVYYHLKDRFCKQYFPFSYDCNLVAEDNVFGIVIVQEEPHFFMDSIYDVARKLIEKDGIIIDIDYLKKHIGLLSIYDYERIIFCKCDIVNLLCRREEDPYHNFDLNYIDNVQDENYRSFQENFLQECSEMAEIIQK